MGTGTISEMKNLECITLFVEDLLNGPQDRPWGRRTAAFADPAGHVWELAHEI